MNAIVTGGARGLGEAIAARLVGDGANVVLVDVNPAVDPVASRLAALRSDARVHALRGDVSDPAFAERAVGEAIERLGGLDVLVNNAGIGGPTTRLIDTPVAELRTVIDVNLLGSMYMARAAARAMVDRKVRGTIVNIGSLFGQQGMPGAAAYCASKAGVSLLSQSLAVELAPHGIRVNTVAPGYMATEMHWEDLRARAADAGTTLEEEKDAVGRSVPLGRHGVGADVAGAIAWLVSEDASYVTGQTIAVNGGVFLS